MHVYAGGNVTGPDLADAAGITYRQLDYWTRAGYLTEDPTLPERPPGPGYQRLFRLDQVDHARTMAHLTVHAGMTPATAHAVACELQATGRARLGDYVLRPAGAVE